MEPITLATYGRLIEYDALVGVHTAWQTNDKGQAKSRAAVDWPDMYDVYAVTLMGL